MLAGTRYQNGFTLLFFVSVGYSPKKCNFNKIQFFQIISLIIYNFTIIKLKEIRFTINN